MDQFKLVSEVQGLVESYVRLREEKAQLDNKVFQLNQDNARQQKANAELVKELEALKAKYEPKESVYSERGLVTV